MKRSIQWLVSAMCILGAITAESSQLFPIEASKLESLSDVVLVGTVKAVERDANNAIPKEITDYDIVTVEVAFVLKGTVSTKEVKVRLATRGNKTFDAALTTMTTATFFLKQDKDGILRTAHPGSVAVFPQHHFKGPNNKDGSAPSGSTSFDEEVIRGREEMINEFKEETRRQQRPDEPQDKPIEGQPPTDMPDSKMNSNVAKGIDSQDGKTPNTSQSPH